MDLYSLSDKAIQKELGLRLKRLRLRKNRTQQELSEATLLSVSTIKALEMGKGKQASLIAVLRELGALEQLDSFIPDISVSPLQLAKLAGRKRQRATGAHAKDEPKDS